MWWVRTKRCYKANKKRTEPAQASCCSGTDPCCIAAAAQWDQSSRGDPTASTRGEANDLNGSSTPWKTPEVTEGRNLDWEWRRGGAGKKDGSKHALGSGANSCHITSVNVRQRKAGHAAPTGQWGTHHLPWATTDTKHLTGHQGSKSSPFGKMLSYVTLSVQVSSKVLT